MRKINIICLVFTTILFSSCREEIISPDDAGNINEPILNVTNNSYTFFINAKNISTTMIDRTFLRFSQSRIYSVLTDHSSGFVEIKVQTDNDRVVFTRVYSDDTSGTDHIDGYQPDIITLEFNEFSGRLRLQISRIE
jgi:hypothetical protein